MSSSMTVGICPRCGSVTGTWHTLAECNARYDAAYEQERERLCSLTPTVSGSGENEEQR